jgi:hypothetical protein
VQDLSNAIEVGKTFYSLPLHCCNLQFMFSRQSTENFPQHLLIVENGSLTSANEEKIKGKKKIGIVR